MSNLRDSTTFNDLLPGKEHKNSQTLGNQLESFTHDAGEKIGVMASKFADRASEQYKTGRKYVVDNPAKGIAIATATGIVAGGLLTLMFHRRQQ